MNAWGHEFMNGITHNQFNMLPSNVLSINQIGQVQPQPETNLPHQAFTVHPEPAGNLPPQSFTVHSQPARNVSSSTFIGPVHPEPITIIDLMESNSRDGTESDRNKSRSKESRSTRRSDRRDRDRSRRRSKSRDRNRRNRNDDNNDRSSNRSDRNNRSERRQKWHKEDESIQNVEMGNLHVMPGMVYNFMQQQGMDMSNVQIMQNVTQSGMNMMPNIMANMTDPNMMMMMNQQMAPHAICFSIGMLLPSLPGAMMPARREKPPGCRTIFVGGIPNGISEEVITEIFVRFGDITDVKVHRQGVCHVRFENSESVEQSFSISGYRFKLHEQLDSEATTIFVDYALNLEDQREYEKNKVYQVAMPNRIEPCTAANIASISEKIKLDDQFIEVAPTLRNWLERGACIKKDANMFYSLIQASNNHVRRLFNEKLQLDEEFHALKMSLKDKYIKVIVQFEQVAKILSAANHQRISDHFSKQQRRNIEMWSKMTEEVDNIKYEFESYFDDENEKSQRSETAQEKCDELKRQIENLTFELECCKNDRRLAQDEAERKFEKFKAQFIAQQALQNPSQIYPPLPPPPTLPSVLEGSIYAKREPPPRTPDDTQLIKSSQVSPLEGKLISVMTAFLLIHPLGANLDSTASYVKSILPGISHDKISQVLRCYTDIFHCKTTGIGPNREEKWKYITFDALKNK